ncbi:uncharacterized protein LOC113464541 [Ceratina calcarata]|uniref:Uncharacterized protein LOC113464541 n=1 Tax=Ceratina calcarata TaxID=156304 RepID=A0AAJ7S4L2_9HYME|nr:uncharacterized protein LOC113464541 [Ceratina calcarata]
MIEVHCFINTSVLFLSLILVTAYVADREICDETKCPGPLRYYKDLGCAPIYKNPDDCCATAYNCSFLNNLSKDKCYLNGNEYSLGEKLRKEDANRCDLACTCESHQNQTANFWCVYLHCAFFERNHCFYRHNHEKCCPELICRE